MPGYPGVKSRQGFLQEHNPRQPGLMSGLQSQFARDFVK
jgi:hypothetical protein